MIATHQQKITQNKLSTTITASSYDVLLLLEHFPVYTIGRSGNECDLKFPLDCPPNNAEVHRCERGGQVTYHGPGQLVGYPILDLRFHKKDIRWYLHQLEMVLLNVLQFYELKGQSDNKFTGIWVENTRKIAALGMSVSSWITMHGFALNVCPKLSHFDQIVPCGITDHKTVCSLQEFVPNITVADVKPVLLREFAKVFNVLPVVMDPP